MWWLVLLAVACCAARPLDDEESCVLTNVEEFTSCEEFASKFWNQKPGIYLSSSSNAEQHGLQQFLHQSSQSNLASLTNLTITLSTSVSYTGRVFKQTTVAQYIAEQMSTDHRTLPGNETFYLFGNHAGPDWETFLSTYPKLELAPIFTCLGLNASDSALSFGCAKRNTGVPWHFHGPGFLQMLFGSKQWFLVPPQVTNEDIGFDPNVTTAEWYANSKLSPPPLMQTFTLHQGDIIYFPPMWKHATLNLQAYNAWMSTFL